MTKTISLHWFRQDLRTSDNPALFEAARQGSVLPVYILDDENAGDDKMGSASRWWLHHSLKALNKKLNGKLIFYTGDPGPVLLKLCSDKNITAVYWNRCYEPWQLDRDEKIRKQLETQGIEVHVHGGSLLWEPLETLKDDGTPYKVFTPFYRKGCLKAAPPRKPIPAPENLKLTSKPAGSLRIDDLGLLPSIRWDRKMEQHWQMGEDHAQDRLQEFIKHGLKDYREGRNFPAKQNVSRLSPHLHFGELSPNQAWYAVKQKGNSVNADHFLSELAWREFSYSLLYHFPALPRKNLQAKFDRFPWRNDKKLLVRWQQGQTGYPIVDAGMRELWQTGYMHNRVRMIVGSFLVKNLLLHWHHGESWFWDCLVDADLANNSASWQWIAGCGADAAPYFRVFIPVTQGQKFDAAGDYTRHFVPELKDLPKKYLFNPWEAPPDVLNEAGVTLGKTYPGPVVDLKASRERALQAFASLKK